ncbi:MAG: hypothetical protein IPO08_23020 [Xanthomonadales bacterium]|nr:hypothetical protein [Xanthomonadales bacterium]
MKKRSKRVVRAALPPMLIMDTVRPEHGIREQSALLAMRSGWAVSQHYMDLVECRMILVVALEIARDKSPQDPDIDRMLSEAQCADKALSAIRRRAGQGKMRATHDEAELIERMLNFSAAYWRTKSSSTFAEAFAGMQRVNSVWQAKSAQKAA